jgi:drug/metabolite transporter (DMT)-like permease
VLTVASVLLSAVGSLVASRNRQRGITLLPAMGFGMLYGAIAAAVVALALGRSVALPTAPSWWLSLAYLAFAGSVLTFACFLTLQDRVGVGAAGTVGVMTPLLALLVSIALEGFRPTLLTAAGAALAVAGNALMLIPARSDRQRAPAAAREAG